MVLLGTIDLVGVSVMVGVFVCVPGSKVIIGAAGVSCIAVGWLESVWAIGGITVSACGKVCSIVARSCVRTSVCAGEVAGVRYWQPAEVNRINAPIAKK